MCDVGSGGGGEEEVGRPFLALTPQYIENGRTAAISSRRLTELVTDEYT